MNPGSVSLLRTRSEDTTGGKSGNGGGEETLEAAGELFSWEIGEIHTFWENCDFKQLFIHFKIDLCSENNFFFPLKICGSKQFCTYLSLLMQGK